jgi:Tfp pilus assembly protein PilF
MTETNTHLQRRVALLFGAIFVLTVLGGLYAFLVLKPTSHEDNFSRLANVGKNYLDKGQAAKAGIAFAEALKLNPAHPDAQLNLANAHLRAGQPELALKHAQEALSLDPSSAASHYVIGCALLRLGQAEPAVKALQQAKDIDVTVNAVTYQLGRALQQAGMLDDARAQFEELLKFDTNHLAGHYNLSQVLARLGRTDEANLELALHQKLTAGKVGLGDPASFEQCKYTEARVPFRLEQPAPRGIEVTFSDATVTALGAAAKIARGPAAVIDFNHDGRNSLFVVEGEGFRLLVNSNGVFLPSGQLFTNLPDNRYRQALVADLNNDQVEEVIMLGERGSQVFKFTTNGTAADISMFSRFKDTAAESAVLVDLDFTAKLDVLTITPGTNGVRGLRNLGHPYFTPHTNTGVPPGLGGVRQLVVEDWDGDDLLDLFVAREGKPPLLLTKVRGGTLEASNSPPDWPAGSGIAVGDLNNDLRPDLVVAATNELAVVFNGLDKRERLPLGHWAPTRLLLFDYDNDGWLDLVVAGDGLRVWRNLGLAGFQEATAPLGLPRIVKGHVESIAPADFDLDGDTDLLLTRADGSLQLLRNDGGNANQQLKVRLVGNRSNACGLGIRIEVNAGGLRLARRVTALPVEIGVGQYGQLDSLTTRWFSLSLNNVDVKVDPHSVLTLEELTIRDGSCPFLYAWDGRQFRFVTDILGAAPAGLRLNETRFVEADPDEYVWVGNEAMFPPRGGSFVMQITEELREVLYLDEAKLVVVDHPSDTEVHTTGKLVPGRPFPKGEIVTLHRRHPLFRAQNHEGTDVTARLQDADGQFVSPTRVRIPQLFGLAEPHSVTLDFGPLAVDRPLVLALTGWLRFGGGTVNAAAARELELPFPFPLLEVETGRGDWKPVDVVVGAPAGKPKSILVDLTGKLPPGSHRLRLGTAFEIHWDRIALFEKRDNAETRIISLAPTQTDLHWRGFSEYENLPWFKPHTPDYARVRAAPLWRVTPAGWCTRYGDIAELINHRDNALALLNGGDELTLQFAADRLPPRPVGQTRDFFLFSSGWDKDADFHCGKGWLVEPIPWHGMDDQRYGEEERPAFASDGLMKKYNTRWVGLRTLARVRR